MPSIEYTDAGAHVLIEKIKRRVRDIWSRSATPELQLVYSQTMGTRDAHGNVPGRLTQALRSAPGQPLVVDLEARGRLVAVAVHPTGTIDADREALIWEYILSLVPARSAVA